MRSPPFGSRALAFAIKILPSAFVAFEARMLLEFEGLGADFVFGNEVDLPAIVVFGAFGGGEDGQLSPHGLVEGVLDFASQLGGAGVRVGGLDEVV